MVGGSLPWLDVNFSNEEGVEGRSDGQLVVGSRTDPTHPPGCPTPPSIPVLHLNVVLF